MDLDILNRIQIDLNQKNIQDDIVTKKILTKIVYFQIDRNPIQKLLKDLYEFQHKYFSFVLI